MLFGLATVACWSTVATAFKLALAEMDVFQLLFYANLTALICLMLVIACQRRSALLVGSFHRYWRLGLVSGLLNPVVYYLILFKAYELLPAQVALSINYTWAMVLTLMAALFLGQKILLGDWMAAVVCYGGVLVIATRGEPGSFANVEATGVALALLSTVVWAGYWTLNVKDPRNPSVGLCMNFLLALPFTAALCFIFSGFTVSFTGLIGSVYVGLAEMAIAFLLWSTALKMAGNASRVSNLIFLAPFVSLVIINRILDEAILPATLAGLALIAVGLLFQQIIHRRRPSP